MTVNEEYSAAITKLRENNKNLNTIEKSANLYKALAPAATNWPQGRVIAMFEFDDLLKRGIDGAFLADSAIMVKNVTSAKDYNLVIEFFSTDFGFNPDDVSGNNSPGQGLGIGNINVAPFAVHKYNSSDVSAHRNEYAFNPSDEVTAWKVTMQNNEKSLSAFAYDYPRTNDRKIYAIVRTLEAITTNVLEVFNLTLSISY
jgi:hypothetical protein